MGRGVYSNYLLPLHRNYLLQVNLAATRLQAALRRLLDIMRLHRRVFTGHWSYEHSLAHPGVIRRVIRYEEAMGPWLWE